MSKIHQLSTPGFRSEVDLFSLPVTDTTVESSFYATYKPLNNLQDSNAKIEFRIVGNSEQYIDFSDSFLHLLLQVTNESSDLITSQEISTCNNLLHSLFSDVELVCNSKVLSSSNHCYNYKAYIEKLLSYGKEYYSAQSACAGFFLDTNNFSGNDNNEGYKSRKKLIASSKRFELIDRLHIDLAGQSRYLLNNMDLSLCLTRASDSFVIIGDNYTTGSSTTSITHDIKAKVKILEATLFVRKQSIYPSIILGHQRLLESGKRALYPVNEGSVKFFTIPQGNQSFISENVFNGVVPSKIIMGFVSNASFNGTYQSNPFKFHHYNANYVNVTVNNIPAPYPPLQLDFSRDQYLSAYWMLYTSLGVAGDNRSFCLSNSDFKHGFTLFAFDFQKLAGEQEALTLDKAGSVRIEFKFQKALPEAVNLIVYSELMKTYEVDQFRQII